MKTTRRFRHLAMLGTRLHRLLMHRFLWLVGALSQPGERLCGSLQAWALRCMGVRCASDEVWVGPRCTFDNPDRLTLGRRVVFNPDSRLTGWGAITIGDDFLAAPGLYLNTGSHEPETTAPFYRPIRIGDNVWCGMRVTVCAGVRVGDGAILGAGAVVTRDIGDGVLAAGVPCRPLRTLPGRAAATGGHQRWSNFRHPRLPGELSPRFPDAPAHPEPVFKG